MIVLLGHRQLKQKCVLEYHPKCKEAVEIHFGRFVMNTVTEIPFQTLHERRNICITVCQFRLAPPHHSRPPGSKMSSSRNGILAKKKKRFESFICTLVYFLMLRTILLEGNADLLSVDCV
jgi:hypothetical protein